MDYTVKGLVIMLVALSLPTCARAQANSANPSAAAAGFYLITNNNGPYPYTFPSNFSGILLRENWSILEPSDGTFDYTAFDNAVGALPAGKKIAVDIIPGVWSPNWALNKYEADGIGTFTSIWNSPFTGPTQNTNSFATHALVNCAPDEFPVPWDTTYQADWQAMITSLKNHIAASGRSADFVRVDANGVNADTDELFLMHRVTAGAVTCGGTIVGGPCNGKLNGETCTPPMDTAAWQALGYTPQRLETANEVLRRQWTTAFPKIVVSQPYVDGLLPPIDAGGADTGQPGDLFLKYKLMADGYNDFPYYAAQNNAGLYPPSAFATFSLPFIHYGMIGSQAAGQPTTNYPSYVNWMLANDLAYAEIYTLDANNASFAGINGTADTIMKNRLYSGSPR